MTRDEISAADEAVLRQAIKSRTGETPIGRRTLEGLRVLAARAYGVPLGDLAAAPPADLAPSSTEPGGQGDIVRTMPAGIRSVSEQIQVRILRDYWPREGDRLAAGSLTRISEAEAKPLVRDGVVEWI